MRFRMSTGSSWYKRQEDVCKWSFALLMGRVLLFTGKVTRRAGDCAG